MRVLVVQVLNKGENEIYDDNQTFDDTLGLVAIQKIKIELNSSIL